MIWFRLPQQFRAVHGYWFLSPRLMQSEISLRAAKATYSVFNLMPVLREPANDRDRADAGYDRWR